MMHYHALPKARSLLSLFGWIYVGSMLAWFGLRLVFFDGLIVRCYETSGIATRASIRMPTWGRAIEVAFGPCEIKTFRVPVDSAQPVVETNMLEESERAQR